MKKIKARVFVVDDERIKDYGGLITVSGIVDPYEKIMCRVVGVLTIYKGKKVGVELLNENKGRKEVIIGEENIKKKLWERMVRMVNG